MLPPPLPQGLDKCVVTRVHLRHTSQSNFTALNVLWAPPAQRSLSPPQQPRTLLLSAWFYFSQSVTELESHSEQPFQIGFLYSVTSIRSSPPSLLAWSSALCTLNNMPLSGWISLLICSPAEGLHGCSRVWAVTMKLLQTFVHRFLCGCMFSAPLGERQGTQLLD